MRSKKSKKINRGNIFGGMGSTETATFKLINMILLSVITAIVIYYTFVKQSIPKGELSSTFTIARGQVLSIRKRRAPN